MCMSACSARFVDGFVDLTAQYVLGDPLDEKTTLGPMAHTRFADLVRAQTAEALAKGAKRPYRPGGLPGRRARHALSRAAGADQTSIIPCG